MSLVALKPAAESDPREAILALARGAFAEKGFDGASMQDLARAAGMSAGNFYRYFPSKAAIVEAFIAREMALIDLAFQQIEAAPDPRAAITGMIRSRIEANNHVECAVWAEIVAAAHRRPEIAEILGAMEQTVTIHICRIFAFLKSIPVDEAARRYGTQARMVTLLVRGIEMESALCPVAPEPLTEMVITHVGRIIDDILSDR